MTRSLSRRALTGAAATLMATGLAVASTVAPAGAATVAVQPVRSIDVGTSFPYLAIANDGTIYAPDSGDIDVWAPNSNGAPNVTKILTGASTSSNVALGSGGLAYTTGSSLVVINPAQGAGPVTPVRTITGPTTTLDNPSFVAWGSDGSLWVVDINPSGPPDLVRFAPGVNGDHAPMKVIGGDRTGGDRTGLAASSLSNTGVIAALPGGGIAFAPATVRPRIQIWTNGQQGNVAPARTIRVAGPTPHWLSEGLASDPQGRLYLGAGDVDGHNYGALYVFSGNANGYAAPLLTLGGAQQGFQVPVLPTVASNGTLALLDATIINLGGSSQQAASIEVFKPLFAKPGAVRSLKVVRSGSSQTVSWKAPSNPGGTPPAYAVVVKKGSKTVLSKKVGATKLVIARKSLPTGSLKVTVTAVNAGGSGPGASKSFSN